MIEDIQGHPPFHAVWIGPGLPSGPRFHRSRGQATGLEGGLERFAIEGTIGTNAGRDDCRQGEFTLACHTATLRQGLRDVRRASGPVCPQLIGHAEKDGHVAAAKLAQLHRSAVEVRSVDLGSGFGDGKLLELVRIGLCAEARADNE